MNSKLKIIIRKLNHGFLEPLFYGVWNIIVNVQLFYFKVKWKITDTPMPTDKEKALVRDNVTFIFKSFERQNMAKRLFRNIQHYYPGVKVIIADDSKKPLIIKSPYVKIVQLPFNGGLSKGLNATLNLVDTPFTVRMDDDELLTPFSMVHRHLEFLFKHNEADLVGILPCNPPFTKKWQKQKTIYFRENMANSPEPLIIPHMTVIDKNHIVLGKVPNIFVVRTEKYRSVGYDDNIRMIDHHEFFFRAAGKLVSVLAPDCFVLHSHNPFNKYYGKFRSDIQGDSIYIRKKYSTYYK